MNSLDLALVPADNLGNVEPISLPWTRFASALLAPRHTDESCEEFLRLKKTDPDAAGAVKSRFGGWVGGTFTGYRRSKRDLKLRTVVALDIDDPGAHLDDELRALGCAMVVHPTHTPGRWRAVMPLSRPVSPDDYRALVRRLRFKVTGVDAASEDPVQVMYWPSTPADDERTAWEIKAAPLDPDRYLGGPAAPDPEPPAPSATDPAPTMEQGADKRLLREAVDRIIRAEDGTRNSTLNAEAFRLAAAGALDDPSADVLAAAAEGVGLTSGEVRATLDSARRKGSAVFDETHSAVMGLFDAAPSTPADSADSVMSGGMLADGFIEDSVFSRRGPIRRTRELWAGRFPLGALTLVSGRGASGKSLFTVWLAAQATRGALDGDVKGEPVRVAFVQSEESLDEELRPKLLAAGADMDLVGAPVWTEKGATAMGTMAGAPWIPSFPASVQALAEYIEATGSRLVLLDVLTAMFAAGLSTDAQEDVRRVLSGLNQAAQASGAAIVGVNHLRKGSTGTNGDEVAGSHEFRDSARCLWLAAYDHASRRTTMLLDKYNRASNGGDAFSYKVERVPVDGLDEDVPRIADLRDTDPETTGADWTQSRRGVADALAGWLDLQVADGRAQVASSEVTRVLKEIPGGGAQIPALMDIMAVLGWRSAWDDGTMNWIKRQA